VGLDGTEQIMSRHVTVIGAGIVGICAAAYLQRAGCRVTVLDPVAPGHSASFGNAGGLSKTAFIPFATPGILKQVPKWLLDSDGPLVVRWSYLPKALPWLWQFVRSTERATFEASAEALKPLATAVFDRYAPLVVEARCEHLINKVGQLYVYSTDATFAADQGVIALRRRMGVRVDVLTSDELRQMEPSLGEQFRHGALLPDNGHCGNPAGLVEAIAESVVRNGGDIATDRVLDFEIHDRRVSGLVTDKGRREVDQIVVAAGAWSGTLAARLGHKVPLETHRGYHVMLADPSCSLRRNVGWVERKFIATPMEHGLRIAGTVEIAGLDAPPDFRRADSLLRQGRTMFRDLAHGEVSRWMGHRPCLPSSVPVIGPSTRIANAYFAFGHGHIGLITAPATGHLIAELVTGAPPTIDPTPYRIDRFAP
jgi:D-amino-acid dehydrogenase